MSLQAIKGKVVAVTGAAGTVGSVLCEQCLVAGASRVRALDNAESGLFFLNERLKSRGGIGPFLGDVRDLERLRYAFDGADVIFHGAALKHVELGEYNPFEVVQTNLVGVNNVIRAALDANVERVIFTSSDKAVNPVNMMGASKMMGERLITAANEIRGGRRTRFSSVRFGNVLGSEGSVVQVFEQQLRAGGPLRLTDARMTRYITTPPEAASLCLRASELMRGGEVFVAKMAALRLEELARAMIEAFGEEIGVEYYGVRLGEKLFEELITDDEAARTLDTEGLLILLPPAEAANYPDAPTQADFPGAQPVVRPWHSGQEAQHLSADAIRELLELDQDGGGPGSPPSTIDAPVEPRHRLDPR